jgi:hypothetical protein
MENDAVGRAFDNIKPQPLILKHPGDDQHQHARFVSGRRTLQGTAATPKYETNATGTSL